MKSSASCATPKYNDPAGTEPPRPMFFVPLAQHAKYEDDL